MNSAISVPSDYVYMNSVYQLLVHMKIERDFCYGLIDLISLLVSQCFTVLFLFKMHKQMQLLGLYIKI